MRLVAEHRSEGHRTDRVVRMYTGGVREVIKADSNGEWWNRYIIIPRRLVLIEIRRIRKERRRYWDWWEVLPAGASQLIESERYSGPGHPFTRMPYRIESSRKFVVIYQSGGLDI